MPGWLSGATPAIAPTGAAVPATPATGTTPSTVDLGAIKAAIDRQRQVAMDALAAAGNPPRDTELAVDVFDSAQRALEAPGAAEAISTYDAVDASAIPAVVAAFGGPTGTPGTIPPQFAGREVTTVGRLGQTGPAGDAGERILRVPDSSWSPSLNALWMQDAVNRGDVIKLATGVSADGSSLEGSPARGGVSVFTRELSVLMEAGYTRQGDYLVPPR
jgi:hypothetical protein